MATADPIQCPTQILISAAKVVHLATSQLDPPLVQIFVFCLCCSTHTFVILLFVLIYLSNAVAMPSSSAADTAHAPAAELDPESKPNDVPGDKVPDDATVLNCARIFAASLFKLL